MAMRNPYAAYKQQARISESKKAVTDLAKKGSPQTDKTIVQTDQTSVQTELQEMTIEQSPELELEDFFQIANMPSRPAAKDTKLIQKENPYLFNAVMTASPEELTSLLYGGAIKFMKHAKTHTLNNNLSEASHANLRAQEIFSELMCTLDMENQPEMSQQLYTLYEYINYSLKEANLTKDIELIEQMIEYTNELRTTWQEAIKITKTKKPTN